MPHSTKKRGSGLTSYRNTKPVYKEDKAAQKALKNKEPGAGRRAAAATSAAVSARQAEKKRLQAKKGTKKRN